MRTFTRALFDLTVIDGEVLCQDGALFNRAAYSRFKYGFLPPALEYGLALAALIADELWEVSAGQPIRVVSAPYKCLPTASDAIAQVLCAELSRLAVANGLEPLRLVPFHKARVSSGAYAQSSEADRLKSQMTSGLHLDESLVPGTHWLAVDDVQITGSVRKSVAAYLEPLGPASVWYLHAARLPEDIGKEYPALEHELNQTVSHALGDILHDINGGQFRLNTRVLRHFLEVQDTNLFRRFLAELPTALLEQIHEAGIGSGVAYYRKYERTLHMVWEELGYRRVSTLLSV